MLRAEELQTILEEEAGHGWRTKTDTRTLMCFRGGGHNRYTIEVEYEEDEDVYYAIVEDSIMSSDFEFGPLPEEEFVPEFREMAEEIGESPR